MTHRSRSGISTGMPLRGRVLLATCTMFRRTVAAIAAALSLAAPQPALASVESSNEATADVTLTNSVRWHRYGTGSTLTITPAAADTFTGSALNAAGAVELARWIPSSIGPNLAVAPWWNVDRRARQCSVVTGVGVEHVDVPFNSMSPAPWAASGWVQPDYGDLVPTIWNGTAQSTAPFWLATPFDTSDGHVFVRVDFGAGGSRTICLNFGSEAGGQVSQSNRYLGQNWGQLTAIYEMVNPFGSTSIVVSNPTNAAVTIATNPGGGGGGGVTLAPGATTTINLTGQRTLYSTGALIVRGTNTTFADETLAPLFHQGTLFVSRTSRNVQQWCFAGANGTTITIDPSSGAPVTFSLNNGNPCRTVETSTHTVITSSAPVSVFHVSTNSQDPHPLYPATDDPLYGIPSRSFLIGATGSGTFSLVRSSDASTLTATAAVSGGEPLGATAPGAGSFGAGPTYRVTPSSGLLGAAIQQADSNGTDSTSFLPVEAMSSRYVLPIASGYTSIACPRPGEVILVNGSPSACSGVNVGHLLLGPTAAGTVIESQSGAAFYLYYQPGTDETNALIPRLNWAQIEAAPGPIESVYNTPGTWTSQPVSASTDVWGMIGATTTLPAGTSVAWEIACAASAAGPFTFTATAPGEPLPHACDWVDWVRVRAALSTSDRWVSPQVWSATAEHSMPVIGDDDVLTVSVADGANWLWRIHADGTLAAEQSIIETRTATSTGVWVVALVDGAMTFHPQVEGNGSSAAAAGGGPAQVHVSSVFVKTDPAPSGVDEVVWRTTGASVWSERTIELTS